MSDYLEKFAEVAGRLGLECQFSKEYQTWYLVDPRHEQVVALNRVYEPYNAEAVFCILEALESVCSHYEQLKTDYCKVIAVTGDQCPEYEKRTQALKVINACNRALSKTWRELNSESVIVAATAVAEVM